MYICTYVKIYRITVDMVNKTYHRLKKAYTMLYTNLYKFNIVKIVPKLHFLICFFSV